MEEFLKIDFKQQEKTLDNSELVIIKGLVVIDGTQVKSGLTKIEIPCHESSLKAFKFLFGVKKRPRIYADDESATKDETVAVAKENIIEDEEDEEDFDDEEEEEENDDLDDEE